MPFRTENLCHFGLKILRLGYLNLEYSKLSSFPIRKAASPLANRHHLSLGSSNWNLAHESDSRILNPKFGFLLGNRCRRKRPFKRSRTDRVAQRTIFSEDSFGKWINFSEWSRWRGIRSSRYLFGYLDLSDRLTDPEGADQAASDSSWSRFV